MGSMFLVHDMTGLGADFDVLDLIIVEDKIYAVLMPSTENDALLCGAFMEMSENQEEERDARDVCILEYKEDTEGKWVYQRVEEDVLTDIFERFRRRNANRFRFG